MGIELTFVLAAEEEARGQRCWSVAAEEGGEACFPWTQLLGCPICSLPPRLRRIERMDQVPLYSAGQGARIQRALCIQHMQHSYVQFLICLVCLATLVSSQCAAVGTKSRQSMQNGDMLLRI
ncbi:hypothetical protein CFC21_041256 [Triticum aestivum]|uniref:Uncharacterized protein n=2 Tax=Triticum aestivum TaxID=4565 RepID=A0A3B6FQI3_WHEAT|nr:hypothetical protein CFC21_041256 [Triticum aestivum]